MHRLRLVEEHGYNETDGKEEDQKDNAQYYVEDMDALETLNRLVYVMIAIFAVKYRNKGLIEGQIKDPVHK